MKAWASLLPAEFDIEPVDIDDQRALSEWYGPIHAAELADWPEEPGWSAHELAAIARDRSSSKRVLRIARDEAGTPVGSVGVRMPTRDNLHEAEVQVAVTPGCRGRGIGRALLASAEEIARAHHRVELVATTDEPVEMAEGSRNARVARAAGYEPALAEARRALELPVPPEHLAELEASCQPWGRGYQVLTWVGPTPEELLEGRVALARSISIDAPQGKLARQEENWDATRVRDFDKLVEAMDRTGYVAGAVETSTRRLVGFTEIAVPRSLPGTAYQFDTVVLPEHRGHRLGMLVKIANLQQLAEHSPATRRVLTWNAATNEPMLRVNQLLGFELVGTGTTWRKVLG
ncbi:MAG: GNAT family N-acetyltransferase [Acidimicrobiales bacterium]